MLPDVYLFPAGFSLGKVRLATGAGAPVVARLATGASREGNM